ncbi:MAG: helix-turn-helix transcriptional regulator [Candidatus Methanomethyliaceae archaeon]
MRLLRWLGEWLGLHRRVGARHAMPQAWHLLTRREQQVAWLVCQRLSNRQIAQRLVLSTNTVKGHVHRVLVKFGVRSKAELRQVLGECDLDALDPPTDDERAWG